MPADWNYIWLGYGVVWGGIALYGASILWRLKRRHADQDEARGHR